MTASHGLDGVRTKDGGGHFVWCNCSEYIFNSYFLIRRYICLMMGVVRDWNGEELLYVICGWQGYLTELPAYQQSDEDFK